MLRPNDTIIILDDKEFDWMVWLLPQHAEWLASCCFGGDAENKLYFRAPPCVRPGLNRKSRLDSFPTMPGMGISDTLVCCKCARCCLSGAPRSEAQKIMSKITKEVAATIAAGIRLPVLLAIQAIKLIVDGELNNRNHAAATFAANVKKKRFKMQTEGVRNATVTVCDHPKIAGAKIVLGGNITTSAIQEGFRDLPEVWEKLVPGGTITVLDYGACTTAQMEYLVADHGEAGQTAAELYAAFEKAYLSMPVPVWQDVVIRMHEQLSGVFKKGKAIDFTADDAAVRKALADRWRGTVEQNWVKNLEMRAIAPMYRDHLARLENDDSALFNFKKTEYVKMHTAWKADKEAKRLSQLDDSGFPPNMAKAWALIETARTEKASKAAPALETKVEPMSAEQIADMGAQSPSAVVKALCDRFAGNEVADYAALEAALVAAETTEGNPLYDFFAVAVTVAVEA